jgi:uncharacterized protein YjiS (DUF1127 family)
MATASHIAPSVNPFFAFVSKTIASVQEARARRVIYNTTVRELRSLSNRELADLGLSRSNISSVAYEHAYNK